MFVRVDKYGRKLASSKALVDYTIPLIHRNLLNSTASSDEQCEPVSQQDASSPYALPISARLTDQTVPLRLRRMFYETARLGDQICFRLEESRMPRLNNPVRFKIILSVRLLREALRAISQSLLRYSESQFDGTAGKDSGYLTRELVGMVYARGWCPWSLDAMSISTLYYAMFLPAWDGRSHAGCTSNGCMAVSRCPEDGMLSHAAACVLGDCQSVGPSEEKLEAILEAGSFPILRSAECDSTGTLAITPFKESSVYIAISHVWQHGLYNVGCNQLSACQLRRIFQAVQDLLEPHGHDVSFWLDTLCVPAASKYRRIAILKMRHVYQKAHYVLVLDSRLAKVDGSMFEKQLQLFFSDWMRRLRTLQEALLPGPDRVFIQFKDGVECLSSFLSLIPCTPSSRLGPEASVYIRLREKFGLHPLGTKPTESLLIDGDSAGQLARLAHHLGTRTTTKIEDEPICLATLLGLDFSDAGKLPTMKDIFTAFPRLPSDIIFSSAPRSDIPGFRWAPSTFLAGNDVTSQYLDEDDDFGTIQSGGFAISNPGFFFHDFRRQMNNMEWSLGTREPAGLEAELEASNLSQTYVISTQQVPLLARRLLNPAIILDSEFTGSAGHEIISAAVLVDLLGFRDGVWHFRYLTYTKMEPKLLPLQNVHDEEELPRFSVRFEKKCRWCVK